MSHSRNERPVVAPPAPLPSFDHITTPPLDVVTVVNVFWVVYGAPGGLAGGVTRRH